MDKHNCGEREVSYILKKGNQNNHEQYVIPPGMEMWANEPLYLLIARWCIFQKRWINRNDIAFAFHLTDRRASFQIYYILRKKSRIVSYVRNNIRNNCNEIWVENIITATYNTRKKTCSQVQKKAKYSSRGVGNGMTGNVTLWDKLIKKVFKDDADS
ncbi:CaiF/GrlA family transcriptional regulator [Escherichia coli]|uniref:CaiF/GrlA family transcriptional regulator n=1 Tax=Escherichia coli TaxID=562 RepID=UPI0021D32B5C|nr:CaiF/GrlA family transcriptional regulator [Escherichia coli]